MGIKYETPSPFPPQKRKRLYTYSTQISNLTTCDVISPLISILSHLHETHSLPPSLHLLYSLRAPPHHPTSQILFYNRLKNIFTSPTLSPDQNFSLFLTGDYTSPPSIPLTVPPSTDLRSNIQTYHRRFEPQDLIDRLPGQEKRGGTVAYVCGPPRMTDEVVGFLRGLEGLSEEQVLCEKWW